MYKILIKDHQYLQKVFISVGNKNGKKKQVGREKNESKNRAKKKPETTSTSE